MRTMKSLKNDVGGSPRWRKDRKMIYHCIASVNLVVFVMLTGFRNR